MKTQTTSKYPIFTILLLLLCICIFNSCKRDRISHQDSTYIYVWKYNIKGDSTLHKYHQPIYHHKVYITDKKKHRRYVGVPGKGGHHRTYYYISYKLNGELIKVNNRQLYNQLNIGDAITVKETFYPYHERKIIYRDI